MEGRREFHTQRLDSTATRTTLFLRRKRSLRNKTLHRIWIQTGAHQLTVFLIVQILMRDLPSPMVEPELCHIHRSDSTASLTIKWPKRETSHQISQAYPTAQ